MKNYYCYCFDSLKGYLRWLQIFKATNQEMRMAETIVYNMDARGVCLCVLCKLESHSHISIDVYMEVLIDFYKTGSII